MTATVALPLRVAGVLALWAVLCFLLIPGGRWFVRRRVNRAIEELQRWGAHVHIPRGDRDYEVAVGLRMLTLRHFVEESGGIYRASENARDMLRYYANSIEHFLRDPC